MRLLTGKAPEAEAGPLFTTLPRDTRHLSAVVRSLCFLSQGPPSP